jgi:hypothetical protein
VTASQVRDVVTRLIAAGPGPLAITRTGFSRQATTSFRSGHDRWTITACSLGAPAAVPGTRMIKAKGFFP